MKVGIDQMGAGGSATFSLVLLTGLDKAQGSQVIATMVLFADLEPLAERQLVTCWLFWGLAALSVTSFPNP